MLDETQETIARSDKRIFTVLAGPGAGKTRVVCERARWLVEDCGVEPRNVVIFTFTKKAASEIQERLKEVDGIIAGTFHSILLQWIKSASPESSGMPYGIKGLATESELRECEKVTGRPFDRRMAAETQTIGFDQIMEIGFDVISKDQSLTQDTHFIVDESQDNSEEQWEVVNAIASSAGTASLMVVGDFRQSIYEWRGATPEMGKAFAGKHKVYHLSKNYRSGSAIVHHTNRVIALGGFEESMMPCAEMEGSVEFVQASDPYQTLCGKIEESVVAGKEYEDIAVLARLNAQADTIANYLTGEGIPCYRRSPSWHSAMDRLCAWASMMADPHNAVAWSVAMGDMIALPDKKRMIAEAAATSTSLFDLMLIKGIEGVPVSRILHAMDGDTIAKLWSCCGGDESLADSIAGQFSGVSCREFAEALCTYGMPDGDGVCVGTVHSVKGLEYDSVFFMHCAQRVLPGPKQGRKKEEDRRLVFVGATRAKSSLCYINYKNEDFSEFLLDKSGRFLV